MDDIITMATFDKWPEPDTIRCQSCGEDTGDSGEDICAECQVE